MGNEWQSQDPYGFHAAAPVVMTASDRLALCVGWARWETEE